ncbi:MAG: LysM peptidoglycan-binding domain-containing protein [Gammaproteobacteria bacterium]|nr:LysM peptidoglycan-binding domain-containing protein [Gammaproteobacteria bacterium]
MTRILLVILILVSLTACQHFAAFSPSTTIAEQPPTEQTGELAVSEQRVLEQDAVEFSSQEIESDVAEVDNLWWVIRNQLHLPVPENKRVIAQRNWYAKHPSYISRVSARATPYLNDIYEQLAARNMPMELALLPIVESAFDPFAYSHGRASGMWQFIPGTGKRFGLRQNWWYDGRRDVYQSTRAALDYLEYLHRRFDGDWLHAVAAYNSGEGNVIRAIRKNKRLNKATDFWSLDLPRETEAYVPKLLALADLLRHYDTYQLTWTPIAKQTYFARVTVDSQIDLVVAAEMAELDLEDFYTLNPAFNHWATEPKRATELLLPVAHVERFKKALAATPKEQRIAFKRYIIQPGDSLLSLAKKFNTTVDLLRSTNGIRGNMIRQGQALLIPTAAYTASQYSKSSQNRRTAKQNRQRDGKKLTIAVQRGDSFWSLAKEYKVGMRELAAWNSMAPTDPLKVGQKLVVWTDHPQGIALQSGIKNKTRKIRYSVRRGDSIARIAGKFNVRVADVVRWNQINPKKYLQPGQRLTLYVDITQQH